MAQSKPGVGKGSQKKPAAMSHKDSSDADEHRLRIRLQFNPHDSVAHQQLIDLLEKRHAYRAVVTEQASWLKNNPNDSFSLLELVGCAKTILHDPEFAIAQERWVLDHTNRDEDDEQYDRNMDMLAADLDKRGRHQEALRLLNELVRLNPEDGGLWADRAAPLLHLGQFNDAIQSFRRSLELDASIETIHEGFADALAASGDLAAAESEYRAALSVYNAKYKKGETSNAADALVKGLVDIEVKFHSEHALAETHLKLARVLMSQKKWTAAVKETQAALDVDTFRPDAYYLRAEIYDAQGDHPSAAKARQAISAMVMEVTKSDKATADIEVDPRVVLLLDNSWANDASDPSTLFPSEVVSILEPRILNLTPFEHLILSGAYLDIGRVPDAIHQFEQCISSDSRFDTDVAQGNFGERLLVAKAPQAALPHLQRAYELDPQNMTYRMDYQATKETVEQKKPL